MKTLVTNSFINEVTRVNSTIILKKAIHHKCFHGNFKIFLEQLPIRTPSNDSVCTQGCYQQVNKIYTRTKITTTNEFCYSDRKSFATIFTAVLCDKLFTISIFNVLKKFDITFLMRKFFAFSRFVNSSVVFLDKIDTITIWIISMFFDLGMYSQFLV